nr:MAG TPA: hypothetical protein [Bacteriophage sp.]
MGKIIDLTGQTFGRLKVVKFDSLSKNNQAKWKCKCKCGNEVVVAASHLKSGHTKSCGCLSRETSAITMHNMVYKNGCSQERLYAVWSEMLLRCNNSANKAYKHYGGRGIKVCKEWQDYLVFNILCLKSGHIHMGTMRTQSVTSVRLTELT